MKCPHCLVSFFEDRKAFVIPLRDRAYKQFIIDYQDCPTCIRTIVRFSAHPAEGNFGPTAPMIAAQLVYPKTMSRAPLSEDVPDRYATDYREACAVLTDSPKASAALSRRCLQLLLREQGVKPQDLSKEIDEVLASQSLPSHLSESIDAIRHIGNFGAHPIKSKSTGEIVEVEPGEAEWQIEVLEGLFDFYFVQPAITKRKRDALNKKLADAGKPELK